MSKKGFIKNRKAYKVILVLIGIIVLFFLLFKVFIYDDTLAPGKSCKIVISRITHGYIGKVTRHCSYGDDCDKTVFVSGRLNDSDYKKLKESKENPFQTIGDVDLCSLFE